MLHWCEHLIWQLLRYSTQNWIRIWEVVWEVKNMDRQTDMTYYEFSLCNSCLGYYVVSCIYLSTFVWTRSFVVKCVHIYKVEDCAERNGNVSDPFLCSWEKWAGCTNVLFCSLIYWWLECRQPVLYTTVPPDSCDIKIVWNILLQVCQSNPKIMTKYLHPCLFPTAGH
jgi:hypothetical protein